jgi:hypothetical protein
VDCLADSISMALSETKEDAWPAMALVNRSAKERDEGRSHRIYRIGL